MSRTTKDSKMYKKKIEQEGMVEPVHKEIIPEVCPDCGGLSMEDCEGNKGVCPSCLGEGEIYE